MKNFTCFIFFLASILCASQLPQQGLLAYYDFQSDFNNQSSSSYHLSPVVDPSVRVPVNPSLGLGVDGQGVRLNGSNALINNTLGDFFQNTNFDQFTISYWIKAPASAFTGSAFRSHFEAFESVFVRNNGPFQFGTATSPTNFNVINGASNLTNSNLPPDQWTHIVLIFNFLGGGGSGSTPVNLTLFVNTQEIGRELITINSNNFIHQFTNQFILGAGSSNGSINYAQKGLACEIDEFIFYSRDVRGTPGLFNSLFTLGYLPARSPVAPPVQTFCASSNPTVAFLTATGTNRVWHNTPTGGSGLSPGTPLTSGTYYVSQFVNGATSKRTPVQVIITQPTVPTFNQVSPICRNQTLSPLPTTSNNGISGTWSPALDNQRTTTYTFTPTAGQNCVSTATMTIIVNPLITPDFTQIPPICPSDTPNLPNVSINGISGTWSLFLNNNVRRTFIFTPDPGTCAIEASMTIFLDPAVTPVFNQIGPICAGSALSALPTTSTNGITGTWSPALNNQATTTYTFTPSGSGCATTTIMTIVVNPQATPAFTQVAPICQGQNLSPLPTTSTNGINGTWSPALNNQATTTYTFTPAGGCANTTTMTIIVNSSVTPVFTQIAPICAGTPLAALPTTSNNGVLGTWSPRLSTGQTTTYTFTPTDGCSNTATMTITVNPRVTPTFAQVAPICAGGTLSPLPRNSNNGVSGTWGPALNNQSTTTYTFTPDLDQCAVGTTMTIVVNPSNPPSFTQIAAICTGDVLNPLPTTSNNGVTGTWAPALNNQATTTYTFTPAGGCSNTATMTITVNPRVTPAFTQVAPICAGATLSALPTTSSNGVTGTWAPALNNQATTTYTFTPAGGCSNTATMTITVNPRVTPAFTQVAPICAGATLSALPTTSSNGVTGTWAPALNNQATTTYTFTPAGGCAETATMTITVNPRVTPAFTQVAPICAGATLSALPTTSSNGVTGTWAPALNHQATTTYTFTPAGGCSNTATMTITVNPRVTPAFTQVAPICAGATLSALPTTSSNGVTGTWAPALNNQATTTYTFTPAGGCSNTATMTITVNPRVTPAFTQVAPICAGGTLSALPTTSSNGVTGTWAPALNNQATTTYTFTPAGGCSNTATMTITVNPRVTPAFTQVAPICAGATLSALPTTSSNGVSGTWAPALNNQATTTYTFTPAGGCAETATMTIVVNIVTAPSGNTQQTFGAGATIADIVVSPANGTLWYPTLSDATNNTNQLSSSTLLVNGAIYYGRSNTGTCFSTVFAVTVSISLNTDSFTSNKVQIYPNPFNEQITINTQLINEKIQVIIHDLLGKQVYSRTFSEPIIVVNNLENLPKGMYMITLTSENGKSIFKKMLK